MGFPEKQLSIVAKSMPDMLGFSGYGGDGAAIELAMEKLPAEQLGLIFMIMEEGGVLQAAKKITAGVDIATTLQGTSQFKDALKVLREKFEEVMNELYR